MSPQELIEILLDRSVGLAIVLMTNEDRVCWVNRGACTLFGCASEQDLIGLRYADLFIEEDRALGADENEKQIALARGYSDDDRWHRRIDGSRFWASGVLTALRDDDGEVHGFGKILRNRTELREQVVELTCKVESLLAGERKRTTGLAATAHEIRNSLSGMSALMGMLRTGAIEREQMIRMGTVVERQLDVMLRLSDELLDVAGVKTSESIRLVRTSMKSVLEEAALLIRDALKGRHFWLLMPPGPIECDVDPARMQQLLANLLRNAIKFTTEDGSIWLKLTIEGLEAVIRVEDDGRGIEPGQLQAIFEAFTQAEPATPRSAGIGMGLAIARELARLQGGTIQAVSDGLGRGASFIVRIPLAAGSGRS